MKNRNFLNLCFTLFFAFIAQGLYSQGAPTANFTVSPNPVCSGAVITLQDLSTGNPTAWSYTLAGAMPFPPPQVFTTQNPTVTFNFQGTYSITLVSSNSGGVSAPVTRTINVLAGPNANVNPANSNICLGSTNQVSINVVTGGGGPGGGGVNTYSWSSGSTASQIAVSPIVTTVYTCVITATNGCSILRTSTVNVTPATATITSSPANICPGTTSTIQIAGSGPGPWTYTWSNSSTNNSITSNFATIVSATIQNNNGCQATATYSLGTSTTLSITALSNPAATCAGGNATVSATGASNYTWSTGTSTSNAIVVNPSVTTIYTVLGSAGTCTGLTTYTLQVSTLPTITINSSTMSTCPGGTISLTANGAANYTWTPGNLYTSNIIITPTVSGNVIYTARGINPGCAARNATVSITVGTLPVVNAFVSASVVCVGESIALSASGANSYTWSTGNTGPLIITTPTTAATIIYTVVGANASNCTKSAGISVIVNECTGLTESIGKSLDFVVYPNPSNGILNIKGDYIGQLLIVNDLGQTVKVLSRDNTSKPTSISGLLSGIYFIMSADKKIIQKVIVSN